jgi:amino acid adenylation domain-containing protein
MVSKPVTTTKLSETDRQLLAKWNQTAVDYPRNIPLHKFIEDQVERTPNAIAVVSGPQQLTYRGLNARANQLGHHLRKLGVGPDVLVPICAERSLEMVIALLGAMKAGGAYTPLDPEYPQQRLHSMLEDAAAPVVLTQAHLLDRVPPSNAKTICLDHDWPSIEQEDTANPQVELTGKNLAYCIYTSGSTGKPKGVPNVHEGIVNRLFWMRDQYQLTPADRILQKTPYSFDVSVWEFFLPLITGATLVMARPGGHKDPAYLVNIIQEQKITALHFVPSMLALFLETEGLEKCATVRQVFASGEALSFELQSRFFKRFHGKLHNLYGPTEAAVDVTYWECTPSYAKPIVPIGRPVANTQIHILDEHLQQVPIGAEGELHIGGIQLARGYLNRPELTAEKFIPDPFRREPAARLYKTGDLARYLPDGNIEYLGRIDHQVKLRGFRIELGEIEAVLTEFPGIRQAVVIVREDVPGNQRLVAYLTRASNKEVSLDAVRAHLAQKLPEFMVPSYFVTLDELPLTTSGKVDRKVLPAPVRDETREIVSARNELESKLVPIFEKILGVKPVGVTDDFFELGGQSILAARLLAEVKRVTGRSIPLSAMLHAASVESLARLIADDEAESVQDSVALPIQKGEAGHLPFFAVVVPGVEALGYAALARYLGPQQPFYKLQGKAPIVGKRPYTRQELHDLAQEYITAMCSVQPEGPYCFIGMCDDIQVCEEMTIQLERARQQVGFVANLDTWAIQNTMVPWKWKIHYYATRFGELTRLHPVDFVRAVMAIFGRKVAGRKVARDQELRESGEPTSWQKAYWPGPEYQTPRFQAPILLFKRPLQPFHYIKDPEMGWGVRSRTGVEIHEMNLDHDNLLREPHIKAIGKILAARLRALHAREASAQLTT